jgi:hypothetical protein
MSKKYTVKLDNAEQWAAPRAGGGLRWKKRQERVLNEDDSRLTYYQRCRAFRVFETEVARPMVAPSARPKRKKAVPAKPDLGAEDVSPLTDSAPKPALPSDEELSEWLKKDLLAFAETLDLDVSAANTKAEIRAAIGALR